nr:MAG TPA: hypothetical protein [Caudoviricetes sp.]
MGEEILKNYQKMFEVVILWVYIIRGDDICQKKKKEI